MQTFLPYPNFVETARCLDMRRLGKQRVEALQILRTLFGLTSGWQNHPAIKMWRGYETALVWYGLAICDEWIGRGYKDTCRPKISDFCGNNLLLPPWFGGIIHQTHRSNLLRKDPIFYGNYGWTESHDLRYHWPSN